MAERIHTVLDRIETQQATALVARQRREMNENVEIGPNEISIDLLRAVYRSNHLPLHTRMRAAISALPHEVPRLAVTAVVSEQDFATVLDRRLKRIEEMKLLEKKTTTNAGTDGFETWKFQPKRW
jgi:hypothetical protein